jgi:hypothetical protein
MHVPPKEFIPKPRVARLGELPWVDIWIHSSTLKGLLNVIPNKTLVPLQTVDCQQATKFILRRVLLVKAIVIIANTTEHAERLFKDGAILKERSAFLGGKKRCTGKFARVIAA